MEILVGTISLYLTADAETVTIVLDHTEQEVHRVVVSGQSEAAQLMALDEAEEYLLKLGRKK